MHCSNELRLDQVYGRLGSRCDATLCTCSILVFAAEKIVFDDKV